MNYDELRIFGKWEKEGEQKRWSVDYFVICLDFVDFCLPFYHQIVILPHSTAHTVASDNTKRKNGGEF